MWTTRETRRKRCVVLRESPQTSVSLWSNPVYRLTVGVPVLRDLVHQIFIYVHYNFSRNLLRLSRKYTRQLHVKLA